MSLNPLIIALDFSSTIKALDVVRHLKVTGVAFKIGFELFCLAGPRIVDKILGHDVRVFLDLKFHDIPQTVGRAAEVATRMGVWMFNVHASGGADMMKRAKGDSLDCASRLNITPPLVVAVTVLTSLDDLSPFNISRSVADQTVCLSKMAKKAGLDGVVASGQEAKMIRKSCGAPFKIVTPGIRFSSDSPDDQKRVVTPKEALKNGSHYLVMGRTVLQSKNPLESIQKIVKGM